MLKANIHKNYYVLFWESFEDIRIIAKKISDVDRTLYCILLMISVFLVYAGCSGAWSPSDEDTVKLVRNYYLFYKDGKEIDAQIIYRGEFEKECKCYPVKYRIILSQDASYEKTFYIFKNESGNADIREYKFGIK